MVNPFKKLFKPHSPSRRPSPLLLEMEAVNENLIAIQALLAAQKPPTTGPTTQQANGDEFEAFEPFEGTEESTQ